MRHACRNAAAGTSCAVALFALSQAQAGGFALEQHNARALGAAFAGAQARRADAGFAIYNPASIAGVGSFEFSLNATGVWPISSYDGAQATLFGVSPVNGSASGDGVGGSALVPTLSFAAPISDRLAFGVSAHAPYGLSTSYGPNSAIRYQAQDSEAKSIAVTPMLALQLTENLSVAGGLRLQYIDLSVSAMVDAGGVAFANSVPGFAPGSSDLAATFDGDDFKIGYIFGFIATPTPKLSIGATYSSKINHDVSGDAEFDIASSVAGQTLNGAVGLFAPTTFTSDFNTPASAGIGIEYAASERFTLLASATWSNWSDFRDVTLEFANPVQPPEILIQNWDDGWTLSVGGELAASKTVDLRAGFMFDATPVNDAFASPRIPDADRYWATVGATKSFNEHISADLGLAVAFFEDRPIALSGAAPEDLLRGALDATIETTAVALSMRLRYKF